MAARHTEPDMMNISRLLNPVPSTPATGVEGGEPTRNKPFSASLRTSLDAFDEKTRKRPPGTTLNRVDRRSPKRIAAQGFHALGKEVDLIKHKLADHVEPWDPKSGLQKPDNLEEIFGTASGYVSTTRDRDVALDFAAEQRIPGERWFLYTLKDQPQGVDVEKNIRASIEGLPARIEKLMEHWRNKAEAAGVNAEDRQTVADILEYATEYRGLPEELREMMPPELPPAASAAAHALLQAAIRIGRQSQDLEVAASLAHEKEIAVPVQIRPHDILCAAELDAKGDPGKMVYRNESAIESLLAKPRSRVPTPSRPATESPKPVPLEFPAHGLPSSGTQGNPA
jgi:hypothetical protein